jgi:2-keto-3-deoxy-6-phosphogluconate aldolase
MVTPRLIDLLRADQLMPIIRADDPDKARAIGRTLIAEGYGVLEVSLTTPNAHAVIVRHRRRTRAEEADPY